MKQAANSERYFAIHTDKAVVCDKAKNSGFQPAGLFMGRRKQEIHA
jgi:hypothetical protein